MFMSVPLLATGAGDATVRLEIEVDEEVQLMLNAFTWLVRLSIVPVTGRRCAR